MCCTLRATSNGRRRWALSTFLLIFKGNQRYSQFFPHPHVGVVGVLSIFCKFEGDILIFASMFITYTTQLSRRTDGYVKVHFEFGTGQDVYILCEVVETGNFDTPGRRGQFLPFLPLYWFYSVENRTHVRIFVRLSSVVCK